MSSPDANSATPVADQEQQPQLELDVTVEQPEACKRHVIVRISEADVRRYRNKAADELQPTAAVPGFRPGRAPRKLVEAKFRKELEERTKGSILLDAVSQVMDDQDFSAISEPDFDFDAVLLPEEGPLTFEFDVEVRPDFDLPQWKGLKLKRFSTEPSDEDVDKQLKNLKARFSRLETVDRPARYGDTLVVDIDVVDPESGETISTSEGEEIPVRKSIVFMDGTVEDFDALMHEVKPGETRSAKITLSDDAANTELAGKEVEVRFHVREVKERVDPSTSELLERLGVDNIEDEDDLREQLRKELASQMDYHNRQAIRKQIISRLLADADWALPEDLVRRQTQREIQRMVYELQSAGFPDEQIRARANQIRQESMARTATAIKEHFLLERIAEENDIDAEPQDFDIEILRIAARNYESPRRVRARLEKRGEMDVIRNQIVERKVIDLICEHAEFEEIPIDEALKKEDDSFGCDIPLAGEQKAELPEARHPDAPQPLQTPSDRS